MGSWTNNSSQQVSYFKHVIELGSWDVTGKYGSN